MVRARLEQLARDLGPSGAQLLSADAEGGALCPVGEEGTVEARALARDGQILLLANASFLLQESRPFHDLVEVARARGLALAADRGRRELYAAALAIDGRTRPLVPQIVTRLVDASGSGRPSEWKEPPRAAFISAPAGASRSPALDGVDAVAGPPGPASPRYLNTALRELFYDPVDTAPALGPERICEALLAQRVRSSVPWIFNSLANEIEYRTGRAHMASLPPEIHLSLTGACNIECRFCSYTHEQAVFAWVRRVQVERLDFLRDVHTLRLSSGLGEPTLNPDLADIVGYLAAAYPHVAMNFFTNGLALGRDRLIEALVGNITYINASLNAATRETWHEVCGADGFDRVCSNLRKLHAAKRAQGSVHPLVYGSMVVTRANVHELALMPGRCRSLGIDRFTAIPFFALGYGGNGKLGANDTLHACREDYDRLLPEIIRQAEAHRVSVELPLPSSDKRAAFGLDVRSLYDFASIEESPLTLGRLVEGVAGATEEPLCPEIWRRAYVGSTNRKVKSPVTHFLYPCLGPLGSVDFSTRAAFDFPDGEGFHRLWNNPHYVFLRAAQRRRGACRVCDACRGCDTRDPAGFASMSELLREWAPGPALHAAHTIGGISR